MFWHPQGDYVAVQVDRYTKTRKSTYTSFELFSVKDRDIPMEVLELPNKTDKVTDFAWEPKVTTFMHCTICYLLCEKRDTNHNRTCFQHLSADFA